MALALFAMLENAGDCLGIRDFANHTKLAPTVGTHTDVDIEVRHGVACLSFSHQYGKGTTCSATRDMSWIELGKKKRCGKGGQKTEWVMAWQ